MASRRERGRASYGPVLAAYGVFATAAAVLIRRRGGPRFGRPRLADVLLLGLATFKLSRLLTKEKVLQPVRDPFVDDARPGDGNEVNSKPAGTGVRRAVGELLTCPFCVSVWIATGLTTAFAIAPDLARLAAAGLAAVAVADSSQYAYAGIRSAARGRDPRRSER